MKFYWRRFCDEHGIAYITHNAKAGVGQNKIGLACPWCGDASWGTHHIGASLDPSNPWWKCWRCNKSGKQPKYLICELLGISNKKAEELIAEHDHVFPDDFDTLFTKPVVPEQKPVAAEELDLPRGCRPLWLGQPAGERFLRYLADERGFGQDALDLCERYLLHYALVGEQAWRVVLPVVYGGELVAWVGRSIHKTASLRYKADEAGALKDHVANYDELVDSEVDKLGIVEGPVDFLKTDYYGQDVGLRATCTFGTAYGRAQVMKLRELVMRARKAAVIYDRGASMEGFRLAGELSAISGKYVENIVLRTTKDPGGMVPAEVAGIAAAMEELHG